jgi:DnaJ-class molecular chaperone
MQYHPDRNPDNKESEEKFKEANEIFEKRMKLQSRSMWGSDVEAWWKDGYAWSLAKQGRTEEAKKLYEEESKGMPGF